MTIIAKPPDQARRGAMATTYKQDFLLWTEEQAAFLRDRKFDHLDIENLIDEVISMGKSEIRELENRMAVLLVHLIKWAWQPKARGNSRSWESSIREQRSKIARLFRQMPSLKSKMADPELEFWPAVWESAKFQAERDTGIAFKAFPQEVPWSIEEILQEDWFPESFI